MGALTTDMPTNRRVHTAADILLRVAWLPSQHSQSCCQVCSHVNSHRLVHHARGSDVVLALSLHSQLEGTPTWSQQQRVNFLGRTVRLRQL